ncbi:hypothetical protein QX233_15355 [Chryseobacterium gambrini]|uniref:Uncharacterized protein n=2 Tax=Chryseobacterium TaxID=59732 RepID=A0AAJ1VK37_9FLAO|nr:MULTISPECIES: hypothetical protein [Chryseobacterium]MCF2221645.1 hypothetical protein [Chryseobacterium sp. PS-8]MDN4013850.1 hypothetical protein [Chryseobacterium gambrini]MDN4031176.1 hypothetical protein [Chryseobacterium gambrini]QWA37680.1 hypothetical protein KKI44_17365 [Chryseobacterium sp. ZHDP1]
MKKLEKLVEKSLSTSKMAFVKAGDQCTGGGATNFAQPHLCRSINTSWSSDSIDGNGMTTYTGFKVTMTEWEESCPPSSDFN